MTDPRLLSELTRVTVLFQARALAAAMGLPSPVRLPKDAR
jgi:hypothetical protein